MKEILGASKGWSFADVYYTLMDYWNKEQYSEFAEFFDNSKFWIDNMKHDSRLQLKKIRNEIELKQK